MTCVGVEPATSLDSKD